mmetsp:Transcript_21865/g.83234  ORF Transcript_21865/g.83234 Transcript_21865/m.83234 type:complete len:249 (+) Transcript_21865:1485-2231(+)
MSRPSASSTSPATPFLPPSPTTAASTGSSSTAEATSCSSATAATSLCFTISSPARAALSSATAPTCSGFPRATWSSLSRAPASASGTTSPPPTRLPHTTSRATSRTSSAPTAALRWWSTKASTPPPTCSTRGSSPLARPSTTATTTGPWTSSRGWSCRLRRRPCGGASATPRSRPATCSSHSAAPLPWATLPALASFTRLPRSRGWRSRSSARTAATFGWCGRGLRSSGATSTRPRASSWMRERRTRP